MVAAGIANPAEHTVHPSTAWQSEFQLPASYPAGTETSQPERQPDFQQLLLRYAVQQVHILHI